MTEHLVAPQPTLTRGVAVRIWVALLVANILVYAALATPGILTLSMRFTEIESLNPVAMLSIVIGVSSVAQLVIGPLVGRLSDRTGARIGMRRPWLIGCGIVGLLGTTTIAVVVDPTAIVIAWAVASAAYVAANVVLVSIMIDHVPVHLHGRISFAIAAASFIAPAAGAALVPLLGNSPTWGLLVPAIATVVLLPLLAFALPDRQLETRPPRFTLRELAQSYWINPLGRPSFAALLVTAFCAIGAYAIPQIYLYYVLAFTIKVPESDLPGSVSLLAAIGAVAAIGAGALGGYLSDKLRRRKVFVIGSGLLLIAGTMVMMLARDFATLTVSQFMLAVAGGLLVTILLSVVAEVSNVETTARDAGMFSTVITLPNVIVPLIFGAVFVAAIPDFTVVFVTSLVLAAVACVLTFFIRDVP